MDNITFICVSLKKDEERRRKMIDVFKILNINDIVIWYIVDKHPNGGIYGCFESHWNLWHKNWKTKYICIFEDDAILNPNFSNDQIREYFNNIIKLSPTLLKNKEILFLSYDPLAYEKIPLYKSHNFSVIEGKFTSTLAYIIEPKIFVNYISDLKNSYGYELDIILSENVREIAINPCIVYQNYTESNVSSLRKGLGQIVTKTYLKLKNSTIKPGNYYWYAFVQYSIKHYYRDPNWIKFPLIDRQINN